MASNIFDELQSPSSYDADIDQGWRLISEKGDDPVQAVYQLLQRVYWDAVRDELANAILAFDDYKTFVPEGLPELGDGALGSDYLRELLDLWDPIGLPEEIKNNICASVFDEVKGERGSGQRAVQVTDAINTCQGDNRPLRMTGLLELFSKHVWTSAFQEFTRPSNALNADSASVHSISTSARKDAVTMPRNHIKCVSDKSDPHVDLGHIYIDCVTPSRYRLCCNCMETSSHPREHLAVAYRFKKAGDEDCATFSQELDVLEDHIKGQSLLSFGNAFLEQISFGGLRRSINSRRLFPAGNAHCALMFGPLLIENGMTIHPGGALISTRTLPSLGRHSPREVKEYLRPENYKIIQGCDVFCNDVYSVSPDRRIYEATKRVKDRRFLCSRKQLSGGLFTDYNHSRPGWKAAEDAIIGFFLRIAAIWRRSKLPVGHEGENRSLLQDCADQLTATMQSLFSAEIEPHLALLAQKLGKKQKLAYSRTSNNCQDFCNGLLNYDSYYYRMFDSVYPFIPVDLSPEIEKKADDGCLSYLQSFVKPLKYPVPGSSQRAMLGSAVTMYSSYAQNDADLIDHVYSVRFGRDHTDGFSLGFNLSKGIGGDEYLLKDEEMSCSDRFAASNLPSNKGQACSLADHLLDCPVDNLSVIQTHLHRRIKYYIDRDTEDFMTNLPPSAWIRNRLQILRRLKLLHDFLAEIAAHFQVACSMALISSNGTINVDVKTLRRVWRPSGTIFSRAWHMDKRVGDTLHFAPDIDFKRNGDDGMENWAMIGFLTFGTTLMQTHRQIMGGDELFMRRLKTVKDRLLSRGSKGDEPWQPWKECTCKECIVHNLKFKCYRLDLIAADNEEALERGAESVVRPGHPDYVGPAVVKRMIGQYDWEPARYKTHLLQGEEERRERLGTDWTSTYLLCLRIIWGAENADPQLLERRLEDYNRLERGASLASSGC
ncbi:uncharacterized protein DSM5745_05836 [Aspergillus mulundensis]|uniref:Uncharacterized protein n=1 Tax=Aspergillus mulundensis TaxID=1810919 RepID=A0A3D8RYP8_9EURO|nr:Uncharacterized protein DSM5745_05836 [Aspergillus mulundensis]RDW78984.1 Uncharacterized protein DSM5745_05836 [Aspergillus mulundensis]